MKNLWPSFKNFARQIKNDLVVLYHALKDPAAPLAARCLGAVTVAYALSPIDLIPDFIPVLGVVDDLLLVPLGLWATWRLMPQDLMASYQARRAELLAELPKNKIVGVLIVLLWVLAALCLAAVAKAWWFA